MSLIARSHSLIEDALFDIDSNPDAAADLLVIAADYLISNREIPDGLRFHLAHAFATSMKQPRSKRGNTLLKELKLVRKGRPKRKRDASDAEIGQAFNDLIESGQTLDEARFLVSERFNVSESTASRLWKKWKKNVDVFNGVEVHDS